MSSGAESTVAVHGTALLSAVRRGTHARGAARVAEGVLLGSGVFLSLTALAVSEGQSPSNAPLLFSALLAGFAAAFTWGWVHRRSFGQVAQDLSQRIGMAEVSAACSDLIPDEPQPMVELAARRVLMRVPPRQLWLLALPVSWPLLLAPLMGGVLLSIVTESQAPRPLRGLQVGTMEALRVGATVAADQVLTAVGEGRLDPEQAQDALALAQSARELRTQAAEPGAVSTLEWAADLAAWLEAAQELERQVAGEAPAQEALARARRAGEAALMAAAAGDSTLADAGPNSGEIPGQVSPADTSEPQTSVSGATTAPEEGTIPPPHQTAEAGLVPPEPLPPVGVQPGGLPSARDARLVQRWLEHLKNQ